MYVCTSLKVISKAYQRVWRGASFHSISLTLLSFFSFTCSLVVNVAFFYSKLHICSSVWPSCGRKCFSANHNVQRTNLDSPIQSETSKEEVLEGAIAIETISPWHVSRGVALDNPVLQVKSQKNGSAELSGRRLTKANNTIDDSSAV